MSWWQLVDLVLAALQLAGVVVIVLALCVLIHLEGGSRER